MIHTCLYMILDRSRSFAIFHQCFSGFKHYVWMETPPETSKSPHGCICFLVKYNTYKYIYSTGISGPQTSADFMRHSRHSQGA